MTSLLFVLVCAAFAQAPPPVEATPTVIVVNPGSADFPLALPKPQIVGVPADLAEEIWTVVRDDLELTGYFQIIDPNAYIEQGGSVEPGTFTFDSWRMIKARGLAKIRVSPGTGGLQADVYVYDVNVGAKLDAKGYGGTKAEARYLGHRIADQILLALTGHKGFFGTRIAVVGVKSGHKEIFVMDIDGHGVQTVTSNGTINLSPAWSPTGDRLAYTSFKRDNADVYVKDLKTGSLTAVSAKGGVDSGAAFSPDGKTVAVSRSNGRDSDIYLVDAKTGADVKRLTSVDGIDVDPSWSPDGTKIAYASERSGGLQVYVQDVASGVATRVTFTGVQNSEPVWSPDGETLAFVGRDVHFDVFTIRTDGTGVVRLTQDQGDNESPCWSRDGNYIMFSSTRDGASAIYLTTADGRHQRRITKTGGWSAPAWGP